MKKNNFTNYKLGIAILFFFGFIAAIVLFSQGFIVKANKVIVINGNSVVSENELNKCSYVQPTSSDEVVEKRGYNTQTFRNPDESYRAEISAEICFFMMAVVMLV